MILFTVGGGVSQHALQVVSQHALQQVSWGWYPSMPCRWYPSKPCRSRGGGGGVSRPTPGRCIPACTEADPRPRGRLLPRAVCTLLECILVINPNTCWNNTEQESIPIGCVPPAFHRMGGLLSGGVFLTDTPPPQKEHGARQPDKKWHHTEIPQDRMTDAS